MSDTGYSNEEGHPALDKLEDGTKVRYEYKRGDYSGEVAEAKIQDGHILYNGERYSPTGAARTALRDLRGEDYELNGWKWWEYYDSENKEWKKLDAIR